MKNLFANASIVIAIRDDKWTGVLADAYDNDDVYYGHHEGALDCHGVPEDSGFVPRGEHYVIVSVSKNGAVSIDTGYHKDEIPTHAYVLA